jgi:adenylate cyclase 10
MKELRDYRKIKIPFIIEKVLGNIIDALKCMEIIILKQASVIGNIFDIDILSDLLSTFSTNFDDLFEAIKNFESFGIIEVLYDLKPKHLVAMFSIPLMREVLYQRLLVEQRCDIHSRVARKMEFSKYSYMAKKTEYEILKRHLEASESTLMTSIEEDNMNRATDRINGNLANRKILITKDIIEKLKIVDLKITSSYSEIKKQFMPMLLSAKITKKDEHGGKKEERYAVLTNKKLCYYYNENNYNDNSEPLASFFLKDIYQIRPKDQLDDKNYYLEIKVSSWYKKSEPKEDRDFIIGFATPEEMSKWEIALNFLRIKNMYDEFTSNFGMIQLPLNNEFSLIENKKYKRKLNIKPRDYKMGGQMLQYSKDYKEEMDGKKKGLDKNGIKGNVGRKKTITNNTLIPDQEKEKTEKKNLNCVDTNAKEIFKYGFGLFLAIIQESISTQKVDYSCAPSHIAVKENKAFYNKSNLYNDENSASGNDS